MKKTKHGFEHAGKQGNHRNPHHRTSLSAQKSGTELLYLECDDTNKVFNIGFRPS